MTIEEDLTIVARLAMETEDRTNDEQRCLLRVCHSIDKRVNKQTVTNKTFDAHGRATRPPSRLYVEAVVTRQCVDDQRDVSLGAKVNAYYEKLYGPGSPWADLASSTTVAALLDELAGEVDDDDQLDLFLDAPDNREVADSPVGDRL